MYLMEEVFHSVDDKTIGADILVLSSSFGFG